MSTIVFVHAHPDDEVTLTSGTMARAAADGHRVVTVFGTGGDLGEAAPDLAPGETVVDRRQAEAQAAARVLGVARVSFLGYRDSGMTGWSTNLDPDCFFAADLDEAAERLAGILDEEDADIVVGYDWHGGYGHPDHRKVHAVTHRAAALAARRPRVLEATLNRDHLRRLIDGAKALGINIEFDADSPMDDGNPIGTPEAEIHHIVDVSDYLDIKREALACHASQTSDIGAFLTFPEDQFRYTFSTEYYIEPDLPSRPHSGWIV